MKMISTIFFFVQLLCFTQSHPVYSSSDGTDLESFQEITFDLGHGPESFQAYVQPNITTFSRGEQEDAKQMKFRGHAAKFFNMGPKPVSLYWVGSDGSEVKMNMFKPFDAGGTASFPGHQFFFAHENYKEGSGKGVLKRFYINGGRSMTTNYYYDPIIVPDNLELTQKNMMKLSFVELEKYNIMARTRNFNDEYKKITGRDYLSMYPREKPKYFMWPADFFGQEHWVTTKEKHFRDIPSSDSRLLKKIKSVGSKRALKDDEQRLLSDYRVDGQYLNMTLKVLSCAPRVYEINEFLSDVEVDHIISIAQTEELKDSTTGNDGTHTEKKLKSRTSRNTWVGREHDQVLDSVYRRSADLMRMDEALFRYRGDGEYPFMPSNNTIAEKMQLVHYAEAQEYTSHHDFGYSKAGDKLQGQRYATLLLYLNDVKEGGETAFPRWVNGHSSEGLRATPKKGKAVLFYSQLPDGNMDDLSQHAALPIVEGEKYLINLWVRDPIFEK